MPLISTTIPNLVNGVSQQPFALRLASQCELQENCYPSVVEGLKKRPSTSHCAKIVEGKLDNAYSHIINRDINERYIVLIMNQDIKVFDLNGVEKTVNFPDGAEYLATDAPETAFKTVTIADYTFILNKEKVVRMSEETSPDRGVEAIVFIKQASHETDYTLKIDDTEIKHSTGNTGKVSTTAIATALADQIQGFEVKVEHSTIWIRKADGSDFTIKVEDSRSNTHTKLAKKSVQRFSDLPTVAPKDFTVEIVGDQSSSFDNYYVKFQPNNENTDFDKGVWIETVKPGMKWKFDASTMPHALVREADGTFSFKRLEWKERTCGDEESAPEPTFVGRRINDIFFYRNRLGFLSDENCIMSEATEFFNFFPTTVTTLVDNDPIDTAASHSKVSILHHAIPFNEELLLFSDQTQFRLEAEDVLSNTTAAIKPMTEFECSLRAKPVGAGRNVFFAVNKGRFTGIREYYLLEDTKANDAADITAHVPQYVAGGVYKLSVSTNEDILVVLSENERNALYAYKYYWSGNEKLQSAWGKWTFKDATILSVEFLDADLYMVMQYEDGVYIERMSVEPGRTDPDAPFEYNLDRKVSEEEVTAEYNRLTGFTRFTLPYKIHSVPQVVTRHHPDAPDPAGVVPTYAAHGPDWIEVKGNYEASKVFIGLPCTMRYRFSRQVLKEEAMGGGQAVVGEGRLQMRYWSVTYANTGYFRAVVLPLYREPNVYEFTGRILGSGSNVLGRIPVSNGTFKFPVMSKNDQVEVEIVSDSFLPCHFISGEWEGMYTIRSKRL